MVVLTFPDPFSKLSSFSWIYFLNNWPYSTGTIVSNIRDPDVAFSVLSKNEIKKWNNLFFVLYEIHIMHDR